MWVVSLNSVYCNIYTYHHIHKEFTLYKRFSHEEAKLKNNALTSDKFGSFQNRRLSSGSFSPHTSPKIVELNLIIRQIAKVINQGRKENMYKKLIIAADPKTKGLLFKYLDPSVIKLVAKTFNVHFNNLTCKEILEKIKPLPIE
jgi:protein required for attachment to host cells